MRQRIRNKPLTAFFRWIIVCSFFWAQMSHDSNAVVLSPFRLDLTFFPPHPSVASLCPTPPALPSKVVSNKIYVDSQNSIIDPLLLEKHLQLRKIVVDEENFLSTINGEFVKANSPMRLKLSECLIAHLLRFARDRAFLQSLDQRGGGQVRLMTTAPLVTYILLRQGAHLLPEQDREIREWIRDLMVLLKRLEIEWKYDNNLEDWTASAYALGAVALDRPDLLNDAFAVVRRKAGNVTSDGVLPQEMARGRMSVQYNMSATQALTIIIVVGQANGIDIFSEPEGESILRLMRRMVMTINDPESFLPLTDEPSAIDKENFDRQMMGWLEIYYRKTSDPEALRAICAYRPLYSWRTGGDWFVFFGHPDQCPK